LERHVCGALSSDFLDAGFDVDAEADALVALLGDEGAGLLVTLGHVDVGKEFGHLHGLSALPATLSHDLFAEADLLLAHFAGSAFFLAFCWLAKLSDASALVLFHNKLLPFFANEWFGDLFAGLFGAFCCHAAALVNLVLENLTTWAIDFFGRSALFWDAFPIGAVTITGGFLDFFVAGRAVLRRWRDNLLTRSAAHRIANRAVAVVFNN